MFRSSASRRAALFITAGVYAVIAFRALLAPGQVAAGLGLALAAPNGYSEMYAVYVGVWLATTALCCIAARRIRDPLWGDMAAVFVLAQPAARLLAVPQWGWPTGSLFAMFFVELLGGLALLAVRPSVPRSQPAAAH